MRAHLERDLKRLKNEILLMGGMVEDATSRAVRALRERNGNLAERVMSGDDAIDNKELEVEDIILKILALHTPVAGDLRYIISILKVNNDLERIGDLAGHIASRAKYLADRPPIAMPARFDELIELILSALRRSLQALINQDSKLAFEVVITDDKIDDLHWESYRELLKRMTEGGEDIDLAFHTISVVRHLERIGDHASNIAEDVYFMVEGEVIRHQVETGDQEDN